VCTYYTHTLTVHSPSASSIFLEAPTSVTIIVSGTARFRCQLQSGVQAVVKWKMNGLPPNVSQGQTVTDHGALSTLVISDVIRNITNISCIAKQLVDNGLILLGETDHVEMLVQGTYKCFKFCLV
jgi:hypothetical protein